MKESLLKREERAELALRELYRAHGYLPYKMNKFEEYDLYVRNKDFLVSDRIIAFSDTNGRLLALKPDVTLSIIKNMEDAPGVKRRVYYSENVYRVSPSTGQYKEIPQTGLECVGDIDVYDLYEAVLLAAKSLASISEDFLLAVSHLGILNALLEEIAVDADSKREITACIAGRNSHDLQKLCADLPEEQTALLCEFIGLYGEAREVLPRLERMCRTAGARDALEELRVLAELLEDSGYASRIHFDFSIVNNMSYYNGIVFRGYLAGISQGVLAGGQYDKLLRRMGRRAGAVGFALYLDLLEELSTPAEDCDVDVLVLYDESTPTALLAKTVAAMTGSGMSVSAQKAIPEKLRYRAVEDLRKGEGR